MASVGVVIPAYNPGPRLERALASVAAQSYADWECVVLDDGGNEPLDWVDRFHPRVARHRQSNAGVSAARNAALAQTSAPLIAYLDQDDEWEPEKLAEQVQALEEGAEFSWTSFRWANEGQPDHVSAAKPITYRSFLEDGHICLSSLVVRRRALLDVGGFNPLLRVQQDYDLVLRLLAAGARGAPVQAVLTTYHLHEANVSGDYLTGCRERETVLEMHALAARRRGDRAALIAARSGCRRMRRNNYGIKAFDAFRESRHPVHLARALQWSPVYTLHALAGSARRLFYSAIA